MAAVEKSTTNSQDRLAVLIDADNGQSTVADALLMEVARYGTATIKRAYGDWTTQNLQGWKDVLHRMAVQPVQQFRYTTRKNATDSRSAYLPQLSLRPVTRLNTGFPSPAR